MHHDNQELLVLAVTDVVISYVVMYNVEAHANIWQYTVLGLPLKYLINDSIHLYYAPGCDSGCNTRVVLDLRVNFHELESSLA